MAVLSKVLPCLAALSGMAAAYDGLGESVVGGKVDTSPPWGLPQTDFQQALGQPNATGQYQITGYNLSSAEAAPVKTRDWTLRVSVKADVPLRNAASGDLTAEDKGKYAAVTVLGVDAPDPFIINNAVDAFKLCAVVYPGLNDAATRRGQNDDGTCGVALPSQCVKDLQEAVAKQNSDRSKSCSAPTLPASCKDSFPETQSTVAFELNKDVLGRNRFYALASQPASFENNTHYDRAVTNVWPVLFAWDHQQGGQGAHTTTADLRCVRASNVMSGSRTPAAVPERDDPLPLKPTPGTGTAGPSGTGAAQPNAGARSVAVLSGGAMVVLAASVAALF